MVSWVPVELSLLRAKSAEVRTGAMADDGTL
jgi:hypothetical protein